MAKRGYDDRELIEMARKFYKENGRPPTTRDLRSWRTILRRWEGRGAWKGFMDEAGLPTYEEWEHQERIKAMKNVLKVYGEVSHGEYMQIFGSGTYPYLPEPTAVWRMFGTKEFGKGGKVWESVRNIK